MADGITFKEPDETPKEPSPPSPPKSSDLAKYRDVGLRVDRYGNIVFRPELATD